MAKCKRCGDPVTHPEDHPKLCCDCYDAWLGMPLEKINAERAAKGKVPLTSDEKERP